MKRRPHGRTGIAALLLALIAAGAVLVALPRRVVVSERAAIRLELPEQAGPYRAQALRFCQNEACMRQFALDALTDPEHCPVCGGELAGATVAERRILPADTIIRKAEYTGPAGESFSVSLVLSGAEQRSMHRPQQCLPAQGYAIEADRTVGVPIEGREPLDVKLLELRRRGRSVEGRAFEYRTLYAYWFVGKDRETPSHLERLFWMSADRILRGIAQRWAYIAVSGRRADGAPATEAMLEAFIADFYPALRVPATPLGMPDESPRTP